MNKLKSLVISHWSLVIVIIIIAAFLRLYNLTELPPGLYPDEAMNGNNALEALSTGNFKVFYPENNGREGLFINIQAIFLKFLLPLTGGRPEPWMLRLPSAIFGILTVLGIYFLARELFPKNFQFSIFNFQSNLNGQNFKTFRNLKLEIRNYEVALLSSFLLATSFWHINFSRIGFRAIMAPTFLVWGLFFLIKALNQTKNNFQFSIFNFQKNSNDQNSKSKNFLLLSIIGGLIYGLGFYSYIAYRATPLLILVVIGYWLLINKNQQIRKKILLSSFLFILSSFIIVAPLSLYFLKNPQDFFGRTTQISVFNSPTPLKDLGLNILKTAGMFNVVGDWNWRHNYAGRPELFWPVGILFIIGFILGIRQLLKFQITSTKSQTNSNDRNSNVRNTSGLEFRISNLFGICDLEFVILFSWFITAALPVVVSNEGIPHALRSILMIPSVFILAGVGGVWLYEKLLTKIRKYTKLRKIFIFSLFTFLFLLIVEAYTTYFILWGQNPNVLDAFSNDYVWLAKGLNNLPKELPKYVVVEATGVDVRGIPMPAQTIMFITDTFLPEKQKEKNIFYVLPNQINQIPQNSYAITLK